MAQAEGMQGLAMADSVAVVLVANKDILALILTPATAALAAVVVGRLVQIIKAQAAPLLWLSSGEVSRHEIRIPE